MTTDTDAPVQASRLWSTPESRISRNRTLRQALVFTGATVLVSLLSAVAKALVARNLSASAFGSFSFAVSSLLFGAMFFEFGLFLPAARLLAKSGRTQGRQIVGAALLLYVPVGLAFSATVLAFSFHVDHWFHVQSGSALRFVAPMALVYPFAEIARWLTQGLDRLHVYSISAALAQGLFVLALVVGLEVADRPSVTLPIALQSLAMMVAWLVLVSWLKPRFTGSIAYVRSLLQQARSFGFQVYVGRLLSLGTYNMDVLMVAGWTDARRVGLYTLAGALAGASGLPVVGMANALFPRMVHAARLHRDWIRISWVVGFVFASAAYVLAKPLFRLVFAPEYVGAADYVLPLALAQVVRGVTGIYNNFLAAHGRGKELRNAGVVLTVSNLALNFLLIPTYGATGAAWASLLALLANYGAHVFFYRRSASIAAPHTVG